jgi:hypothetical protein
MGSDWFRDLCDQFCNVSAARRQMRARRWGHGRSIASRCRHQHQPDSGRLLLSNSHLQKQSGLYLSILSGRKFCDSRPRSFLKTHSPLAILGPKCLDLMQCKYKKIWLYTWSSRRFWWLALYQVLKGFLPAMSSYNKFKMTSGARKLNVHPTLSGTCLFHNTEYTPVSSNLCLGRAYFM